MCVSALMCDQVCIHGHISAGAIKYLQVHTAHVPVRIFVRACTVHLCCISRPNSVHIAPVAHVERPSVCVQQHRLVCTKHNAGRCERACMCVCACVCMCACFALHAQVHVSVHVSVLCMLFMCTRVCVHAGVCALCAFRACAHA